MHASGRFQLQCYKEEIEANLRTPSFSGIQLLDLHDYLGQGGALIGLLDAFWESKGYATPEEFTQFCNTTVPLARCQRVYTTNDSLIADVEVAAFALHRLRTSHPNGGSRRATEALSRKGTGRRGTSRSARTSPSETSAQIFPSWRHLRAYTLKVRLASTNFENAWNFWVYPANLDAPLPPDVLTTSSWPEAEARLAAGGKVLFQPTVPDLDPSDPKLSTVPIFWNRLMNPNGAWMLGLWCDVKHPALASFPTDANCDWQWIDLVRDARALNLDSLPRELQPIVQPIDDWNRTISLACCMNAGLAMAG